MNPANSFVTTWLLGSNGTQYVPVLHRAWAGLKLHGLISAEHTHTEHKRQQKPTWGEQEPYGSVTFIPPTYKQATLSEEASLVQHPMLLWIRIQNVDYKRPLNCTLTNQQSTKCYMRFWQKETQNHLSSWVCGFSELRLRVHKLLADWVSLVTPPCVMGSSVPISVISHVTSSL